jgi:hypothetical protein
MNSGFWIALLLSAFINIVLGALWYHPRFLGSPWIDAHGFRDDTLKGTPLHYIGAFLVGLILAFVLGRLLFKFSIDTPSGAAQLAFCLWAGFIATTHFSGVIWAKKPLSAFLIDTAFYLISLQIIAQIFVYLT